MTTTERDRYLDQLGVSLRVRDVPAARIRELLDEVTTHLDDSGERPEDAFGEPHRFAADLVDGERAVTAPPRRRLDLRADLRGLTSGLSIAAGAVVLIELVFGLATGEPVEVTVGNLVMLAALAVGILLLTPTLLAVLDGRRPRSRVVVGIAALWMAAVAVTALLGQPLFELAPVPAALMAVAFLAAGGVGIWRSTDPIPPSRLDR